MSRTGRVLSPQAVTHARERLLRMHYESGVGHIGGNLSALDALLVLFHEYLTADDTFVLSKGHSAGALYIALWSLGRIDDVELRTFHGDGTRLAGHVPGGVFPEAPVAPGSLGHGLSLAAGTALGLRLRKAPGQVFCLTSDGDWQAGSTWEALIFAAHHRLENLTVLVDRNGLQGFGATDEVASTKAIDEKLRGFDVPVQRIAGHDADALRATLDLPVSGPRIVVMETVKGHGVSFLENRLDSHYLPLSAEQFAAAMNEIRANA